jgi:hypothetical protein
MAAALECAAALEPCYRSTQNPSNECSEERPSIEAALAAAEPALLGRHVLHADQHQHH